MEKNPVTSLKDTDPSLAEPSRAEPKGSKSRHIWVLMCNDCVEGVFTTEEKADAEIDIAREAEDILRRSGARPRNWPGHHWRHYKFELNRGLAPNA